MYPGMSTNIQIFSGLIKNVIINNSIQRWTRIYNQIYEDNF